MHPISGLIAIVLIICMIGCEKQSAVSIPVFNASISPTPIENAAARYSSFQYFYRPVGQSEFSEISPSSVKATSDGSVTASFHVPIDSNSANKKYESYIAYLLDGHIQKTTVTVDYHTQITK